MMALEFAALGETDFLSINGSRYNHEQQPIYCDLMREIMAHPDTNMIIVGRSIISAAMTAVNSIEITVVTDIRNVNPSVLNIVLIYTPNDPIPFLDEGSPTPTGGIITAMLVAEAMGITFMPSLPHLRYSRWWGHEGHNHGPKIARWELTTQEQIHFTTNIAFHLCGDDEPLVIGSDQQRYAIVDSKKSEINFSLPEDTDTSVLRTYIAENDSLNQRIRVLICHTLLIYDALASNGLPKSIPASMANRLYRMTHDHPDELISVSSLSGWPDHEPKRAIYKNIRECPVNMITGPRSLEKYYDQSYKWGFRRGTPDLLRICLRLWHEECVLNHGGHRYRLLLWVISTIKEQ